MALSPGGEGVGGDGSVAGGSPRPYVSWGSSARSSISRKVARACALTARIWTISYLSNAGLARHDETRRPDPMRMPSGAPTTASRPRSAPDKWNIIQIRVSPRAQVKRTACNTPLTRSPLRFDESGQKAPPSCAKRASCRSPPPLLVDKDPVVVHRL